MTDQTVWLTFTIEGLPAPKGSMVKNRYGGIHHDNPRTDGWQHQLETAIRLNMGLRHLPVVSGPVAVRVAFTLVRPASVKPKDRPWPSMSSPGHGDIDKLARVVLDALQNAGCLVNDAQVVALNAVKQYPESGRKDALTGRAGAVVTVFRLDPSDPIP